MLTTCVHGSDEGISQKEENLLPQFKVKDKNVCTGGEVQVKGEEERKS